MQKLIKQERLSYTIEIFKEICQVIGLTLLWRKNTNETLSFLTFIKGCGNKYVYFQKLAILCK